MAGQIVERGRGTYIVRIFVGRDSNGKRRYANRTVHGNRKDAQLALNAMLRDKDLGELVRPARTSFSEHAQAWMGTVVAGRVRERTLADYRGILSRYLLPAFGAIPLGQITPESIQQLYADLRASRRIAAEKGDGLTKEAKRRRTGAFHYSPTSDKLSPQTIRHIHAVLSNCLKQAMRWRLLSSNPCDLVDLPKARRCEKAVLDRDDALRFLQAAEGTDHYSFFALLLAAGMRPGEALALRWGDIDFTLGYLSINRALSGRGASVRFEEPKTPKSRRRVPLPQSVLAALRALRDLRQREAGNVAIDLELVFSKDGGKPLDLPNLARRHFRPLLKKAGLRSDLRIYDLRHSCATLLLQAGTNPKIVSERLGHASVLLTLDTYSHVLPDMQQTAADKLEEMLFGRGGGPAGVEQAIARSHFGTP